MANLSIVIVARNMAAGTLRDLNRDLGALDNHAGIATRGLSGLQSVVRTGLVAAATAGGKCAATMAPREGRPKGVVQGVSSGFSVMPQGWGGRRAASRGFRYSPKARLQLKPLHQG